MNYRHHCLALMLVLSACAEIEPELPPSSQDGHATLLMQGYDPAASGASDEAIAQSVERQFSSRSRSRLDGYGYGYSPYQTYGYQDPFAYFVYLFQWSQYFRSYYFQRTRELAHYIPSWTPYPSDHLQWYQPAKNVVEVATAKGFNTLVAAVTAANLGGTLVGAGPFTIFAPTDAAFAALPAGTLDTLLRPENVEQLRSILLYHVVSGRYTAGRLASRGSVLTVQGSPVTVSGGYGGLDVNSSNVTDLNIQASNGIIHVIDAVLLPPN